MAIRGACQDVSWGQSLDEQHATHMAINLQWYICEFANIADCCACAELLTNKSLLSVHGARC